MDKKKLRKLKAEIKNMLRSPQGRRSEELTALAGQLGRTKFNRGKEPTYIRSTEPTLAPPLSIPNHSKEMPAGTARSILNQLLSDCDEWEIHLEAEDEKLEPEPEPEPEKNEGADR